MATQNSESNTFPADCPFCGTDITRVHPERKRAPPDIQQEHHSGRNLPHTDFPGFHIVSYRRLAPCGHLYQTDDVEAWRDGVLSTRELGDRVQNPAPEDSS